MSRAFVYGLGAKFLLLTEFLNFTDEALKCLTTAVGDTFPRESRMPLISLSLIDKNLEQISSSVSMHFVVTRKLLEPDLHF